MFKPSPPPLQSTRPKATPATPTIQLTALYEDLEAGLRVKRLLDRVESAVKRELPVQFKLEVWRFDWLGEASLRNMALSMARSSALVLVSTSTDHPPIVELERWIRAWTQNRDDQLSALVLLTQEGNLRSGPHTLYNCLQRAARRKAVEFLCEYIQSTQDKREPIADWVLDREEAFSS
jgi:hypothetical protein